MSLTETINQTLLIFNLSLEHCRSSFSPDWHLIPGTVQSASKQCIPPHINPCPRPDLGFISTLSHISSQAAFKWLLWFTSRIILRICILHNFPAIVMQPASYALALAHPGSSPASKVHPYLHFIFSSRFSTIASASSMSLEGHLVNKKIKS